MNRLKINKMKNNRVCIYKLKEIIMKNNRTRILLCLIPSALLVASIIVGPVILGRYCLPALLTGVLIFSLPWIMKQRMALTKHK